jgi:hypothetical protein
MTAYPAPAGAGLTGIALSPDGGVFGRSGSWLVDRERGTVVLQPQLTYLGAAAPARPEEISKLIGYEFAWTGELVATQWMDPADITSGQLTQRFVQYYAERTRITRSFSLPTGFDWVGTDASGNTYIAEVRPRERLGTDERLVVGQVRYGTVQVAVFDKAGTQIGMLDLPWDRIAGDVYRPIQVDAAGRVFISGGDARGFTVYVASPLGTL